MKYYYLLFCCCLLFVACGNSQNDKAINESWQKLTTAFANRAAVSEKCAYSAAKIIDIDSAILKAIAVQTIKMQALATDSRNPDKELIGRWVNENNEARGIISEVLGKMLLDSTFSSRKEAMIIQSDLMAAENYVTSRKKEYNRIVTEAGRKELYYP